MTKLVIFDFDGVLVNSTLFWFGLNKEVNENLTWGKYQSFSHGNFWKILNNEVKSGSHVLPENYSEKYAKELLDNHQISTKDTILNLNKRFRLAIVSSSSDSAIKGLLKKENLLDSFSEVFGSDRHESKAEKINDLLVEYSVLSTDAVFITDSLGDILEANEAGVKSLGVTWGLHDRETLL